MLRVYAFLGALSACSFPELRSSNDAAMDDGMLDDASGDATGDATFDDGQIDSGTICPATNTCAAPTILTAQAGDEGTGLESVQGTTSAWHRIRVDENNVGSTGESMRLRTTLTVSAGSDFDVIVYVNEANDMLECTTSDLTGTPNAGSDVAQIEWGETGAFSNGTDDSRTVSIEVRHVSGPCETWTLVVEGNKP